MATPFYDNCSSAEQHSDHIENDAIQNYASSFGKAFQQVVNPEIYPELHDAIEERHDSLKRQLLYSTCIADCGCAGGQFSQRCMFVPSCINCRIFNNHD